MTIAHVSVADLTVAVSPPTVDIPVITDSTSVTPRSIHCEVVSSYWVVIPLPCDVSADGGISSDVGAIGAWRQCPIHVECERCGYRTARVVGVNGVGHVARNVLRCAPDAAVGRSKGKARW